MSTPCRSDDIVLLRGEEDFGGGPFGVVLSGVELLWMVLDCTMYNCTSCDSYAQNSMPGKALYTTVDN